MTIAQTVGVVLVALAMLACLLLAVAAFWPERKPTSREELEKRMRDSCGPCGPEA